MRTRSIHRLVSLGIASGLSVLLAAPLAFAQSFPPRELNPRAGPSTALGVEEEIPGSPELFDGPDFAVVHPEIRDGVLQFSLTPWAETVVIPGRGPLLGAPVGPPWWDPSIHPPGTVVFVY